MKTLIKMGLAISCILLLGSCIDFAQEIELNRDGSGEFELTVSAPEMGDSDGADPFMSDEEAKAQAEASGVEIIENSVTKANGKVVTKLRVAFDNMDELNAFMKKQGDEGDDMNLQFSLEKSGGETTLRHQVTPEKKDSEGDKDAEMGKMMMANILKDSYYTIQWTLPGEVIEATDGATIEGNKVDFKVPMLAMINGSGVDVSASYKSGSPMWIYFAIGAVVLVYLLVIRPRLSKKSQ